ncbi:MAG: sensor histidine kinase [Gammaproteobacteria bacterium]|jgi:signal transduction histidine kinase|nr:sensor histidine kinase [Gammaproteobacteria bacterium]
MFKVGSFKPIMARLNRKIERSIRDFNPPFTTLAILGLLYYFLFYFAWVVPFGTGIGWESLILRLIAMVLCLGLLLREEWPKTAQKWLPVYWYITLTYCLPFFFTLMFLHHSTAQLWVMAFTSIIFWLVLLVDLASAFILLLLGIVAAAGVFWFNHRILPLTDSVCNIFLIYIGFLVAVAILVKNKRRLENDKRLKTAEAVSHGIAHEMRSPLSAIIVKAGNGRKFFPALLDAYQLAKKNNLEGLEVIPPRRFEVIANLFDSIDREAKFANVFIDMLICNVKQDVLKKNATKVLKMSDCIHTALQRYPFSGNQERLIYWDHNYDFSFVGSEDRVVHLLMNLLKNALYYIVAAGKGRIDIWQTAGRRMNILHFKDTAIGMSQETQDMLFQQLIGHKSNKVGLGLAFCARVMRELGGSIECHSVEGEFSEFSLYFPRIPGL